MVLQKLVLKEKSSFGASQFHELGLLNEAGKPRLNRAIGYFCNNQLEFDLLEDLFSFWRDFSEYVILRRARVDPRSFKTTWEYVAVKCSKRGNDVYVSRIKRRFKFLNRLVPDLEFFKPSDFKVNKNLPSSKAMWLTLTYDTKRCSRREAWENIGHEWNRFISAMRSRYGKISVLRSWEAFQNGYPHVHAVLWFHDRKFHVVQKFQLFSNEPSENNAQKGSGSLEETSLDPSGRSGATRPLPLSEKAPMGRFTYRINEKREFEDLWHSFIDVEAFSSIKKICGYVMKYQLKVNEGAEAEGSKGVKTLAFMWLFRKRSYSVSGQWREIFSDLIGRLHNSNMEIQVSLEGIRLEEPPWEFVGIFSGKDLGINRFLWTSRLNKAQIRMILGVSS